MEIQTVAQEFLHYIENVRNYSEQTVKNYRSDLKIFISFCDESFQVKHLEKLTDTHVQEFVSFTRNVLHNSAYSSARKLRCVRSFLRFAESRHYIEQSPANHVSEPKISKRLPVFLTAEEAQQLLSAVTGKYLERDYAIIMIFLFCGLRVSELSGIDLNQLDLFANTLHVVGKGDKERIVPLVQPVCDAIQSYLAVRPESTSPALFLSYRKTRLSVRGIQEIIAKYVRASGIDKKVSPHKLRHTCATLLYSEGSLLELKQLLGHESVATTQIYAHTNAEQMKKLAESNPLLKHLKK